MEGSDQEIRVDRTIKVTVIGDGAVGKTSLILAFAEKTFSEPHNKTLPDVYEYTTIVDDQMVKVALWDTAGQEDFERLRMLSYPGTDALILCYSVESNSSFINAKTIWRPEVKRYCSGKPIILVGTKTDIRDQSSSDMEFITTSQGVELAAEIKAVGFQECSARNLQNINTVIQDAVVAAINRIRAAEQRRRPCFNWSPCFSRK